MADDGYLIGETGKREGAGVSERGRIGRRTGMGQEGGERRNEGKHFGGMG
jgi:hypothetical protein